MKKIILIIILSFFGYGCAISRQITGPNGEIMHSIDCSGYALNMGMFLEKAGKICGSKGYDIVMGGTSNYGAATSFNQYGLLSNPIVQREIIIRCKN